VSSDSASATKHAGTAGPAEGVVPKRSDFISFAIGDEQYGVDIMAVREIKGWSTVTHLPNQPDYVRGLLNLRGVMVPIIDLRCRFGQGNTETTALHVVIIVQIDGRQVGLLADRVLDIVSFEPSQVQPVPSSAACPTATLDDTAIAQRTCCSARSHISTRKGRRVSASIAIMPRRQSSSKP
jgi:purine-binding chemotaxis protein CheW